MHHALRNAMAPAVAVISLDVGISARRHPRGRGGLRLAWARALIIYALQNRDLPVIQAATLVLPSPMRSRT